jgi:hypothetical protein
LDRLTGLAGPDRLKRISESIRDKAEIATSVPNAVASMTDTEVAALIRVLQKKYPDFADTLRKSESYKVYRYALSSRRDELFGREAARGVLRRAIADEVKRRKISLVEHFDRRLDDGSYRTIENVPYALFDRSMDEFKDHFPEHALELSQFYGKSLLDLGGGPKATFVSQLIDKTKGQVTAISVDLNADVSVNKLGKGTINIRQSFESLPFKDESFDFIYSSYSLFFGRYFEIHSKEFLTTVLSECRRVLKPGGVMRLSPVHEGLLKKLGTLPGLEVRRSGFQNGHWWVELHRSSDG